MYFVYGPGGTRKTFLWSTIISKLRSEGKIVLAFASSSIASLLLDGGRTAHSRFKIRIDVNEFSCCDIKQNTYLTELICNTSLVIWDEATMHHRFIFEAVDRSFHDIRFKVNPDARSLPFGGITILLGGDFRQTLPVVLEKGREEIVASSITKSPLWRSCKVFPLLENMRIERNVPPITIDGRNVAFKDWVLALGDGSEPSFLLGDDPDPSWIKIPDEVHVEHNGDALDAIVLKRLPGDFRIYKSRDSIFKASFSSAADEAPYPPEYLNSLKFSGLSNHEIQIKVGSASYTKNIVYREIFDNIM
ncbi:ATP-dependent DNA helicase [Heracleum sosnowskyi]|uniref:ATP-dependent DNA helicase n=1 Tax=Heracleum sosnowskyi TaxID=360622 RepID=A0AAD8H477_9APIA|nr:ATP-dependent DNA helicase [Heracleum sosnowskyi]